MSYIPYAVIALKLAQVETVVKRLKSEHMNGIADWLDARKDTLYGASIEDWKPFDGHTVDQLLNTDEDDETYHSQTQLIDALDEDLTNTRILVRSGIELFFVDVFSLFSDWHKTLASKLDFGLADTNRKCCLIIPNGLSDDSRFVLKTYGNVWESVTQAYLEGFLHPIIFRAEDITHLRNYLITLPRASEEPYKEAVQEVDRRFGWGAKPGFGRLRR